MTADDNPIGWDTSAAAGAYRDRDMRLAEQLIFPGVLRRLAGGSRPDPLALDIGCGTGAVAAQLARTGAWTVQALDPSADMLGIARSDRPHPRVSYRLFDGRTLDWLADDSVDAAVCCLVYCTDPDDGRLAALTAEIRRVLRPGAPYLLADLNPAATGVAFSTLRHGEPEAVYDDGDTVPTLLRLRDGTTMTSATYYRSLDRYRSFLTEAGFPSPAIDLPTLPADGTVTEAAAETRTAPYMLLTTHA
ncbi:class I SAM-dependent methyltransferase [Streptomyces sp. 5-8]|uniref:Class I SAM-dependent methyltransferase n=1 Tax=Streptomyces musisoli TaxID=2802280 RepID=A0ABS1NWI4_9ACTN|nr:MULTISPECIES: class I SAM-dependent methyltransferase [Streptomyces]MBL1104428.1 class I SAM-dependent methyltransferase [Streptomyces musisoli]MBY8840402.1 methyltransferase domain-containing protein [Streptomyces sp. SP2-10]